MNEITELIDMSELRHVRNETSYPSHYSQRRIYEAGVGGLQAPFRSANIRAKIS